MGEAATAVIMLAFSLMFPYKPKQHVSEWRKLEPNGNYKYWDLLSLPLLFAFVPIITWLFGQIFIFQYQFEVDHDPDIVHQLLPEPECWYVPAGILAFGLVSHPILWVYRLVLKERYDDYELYNNIKHNIDGKKVIRFMTFIMGITTLVAMHFLNDYYIKVRRSVIEVNSLLELKAKMYPFEEVKKLTYIKNIYSRGDSTELTSKPHYSIEFKDGNTFSTNMGLHNEKTDPQTVAYLSLRSGIKIDTLEVD